MATCQVLLRSGPRNGEHCGCQAYTRNPLTGEYYCRRHNKLTPTQMTRLRSNVLCDYGPDGLCLGAPDLDEAVAALPPDPIGDENIKVLKGYINVFIGTPILYEELPLVFMSKLQGFGDNFTRADLAKCIKSTLQYIFTRPDAYAWPEEVDTTTLSNIYIKRIWYNNERSKFFTDLILA